MSSAEPDDSGMEFHVRIQRSGGLPGRGDESMCFFQGDVRVRKIFRVSLVQERNTWLDG